MMENEKKFSVIVSNTCSQMLIEHARFMATVSRNAALNIISEFENKAKSLETMPERNPYLADPYIPKNKYRKLLFSKSYLLIYQIMGDRVYIDYVVDCRQNYSHLIF